MNGMMVGAMMLLSAVQQTDTTFAVGSASKLSLDNDGGTVVVSTWDRDEIRVQAEHSRRAIIEVDRGRTSIELEADARRGGMSGIVDWVVTVPRYFSVSVDGQYTDITIEGVDGEIEAETMQGDVIVRGGTGEITAESTTGKVRIEGASGRITAESVASEVRIVDSSGDVFAESVGGNIILENVQARNVDAGTVGGRIVYAGTVQDDGVYLFGSHGGTISITVPPGTSAEYSLASLHGSVSAEVQGAPDRFEKGQRNIFTVREGGAVIEAETFGGRIIIREAGPSGSLREIR